MTEVTFATVVAIVGFAVSICSLAAFYFNRKKDTASRSKKEGIVLTDLSYIKESVDSTTKAVDKLAEKIDQVEHRREEEYREVLVKFTRLEESHKSLEYRVKDLESIK